VSKGKNRVCHELVPRSFFLLFLFGRGNEGNRRKKKNLIRFDDGRLFIQCFFGLITTTDITITIMVWSRWHFIVSVFLEALSFGRLRLAQ
jgi:hypothetical protein